MVAKVILFSFKYGEINNFLNSFYSSDLGLENFLSWQKEFSNPVDIAEIIAAFVDNSSSFDITMWVSLDKNVFIKISPSIAEHIIKYLFERYTY